MTKQIKVETENAPKALGPYSQAIITGDFIFCSGQIGIDPKNGELVEGGIEEQTRQAVRNIEAVLGRAGATLDQVIKSEVFLKDMNDFSLMNAAYEEFFCAHPAPARTTVEVSRLPKDALIEISCVAYKNN